MTRKSNATNLHWYLDLFKYTDTSKIPYKALAKHLGTNQYTLIAKVGRARKHPTMAEELITQGHITEEQLPPWAAKPRAHILAVAETLKHAAFTPDTQPSSNGSQVAQVSASALPLASATPPASEPTTQPYIGSTRDTSQIFHFENLDGKVTHSNGPYYPPSPIQRMGAKIVAEIERDTIEDRHERRREKEKDRKDREYRKNEQRLNLLAARAPARCYIAPFCTRNHARPSN